MSYPPFRIDMENARLHPVGSALIAGIVGGTNKLINHYQKLGEAITAEAEKQVSALIGNIQFEKTTKPDFKVLPMSSSDYNNDRVHGTPVMNLPRYQYEMHISPKNSDPAHAPVRAEFILNAFKDNRKEFHKLLGPRSCPWTGEFRFDVWRLQFNDASKTQLLVMSAGTKGTCYEAVLRDGDVHLKPDAGTIMSFMKWVASQVKTRDRSTGLTK